MRDCDKFFNTAGPMREDKHYLLPPLERWDTEDILELIYQEKYFLLHAPRQSGKTSTLFALQKYINENYDDTIAIYVNVESAQVARHDVNAGVKTIIAQLGNELEDFLDDYDIADKLMDIFHKKGGGSGLLTCLKYLCKTVNKKVVLFIDEIDSLIGDTLVSVLRQLRSGYPNRLDNRFPVSIILCGLVDIKDYNIHKSDGEIITGGSCFNIKSESLTLDNFSKENIKTLYLEHTKETGQIFEDEIWDLAWNYTGGQPWLVNALAYQVCFKMKENRNRSIAITADMFIEAKEQLILSRQTHLDQLADKLKEKRVRDVIQPMLTGFDLEEDENNDKDEYDDFTVIAKNELYCVDLGLIKKIKGKYVISNDIYKEVLPRELTYSLQAQMASVFETPDWVNNDETINIETLLTMFTQFWRENSEIWTRKIRGYAEAAPHLVFQAFLQRVGNGHGLIDREYGLGMKRADLYLKWKSPTCEQRIIFELKIRRKNDSLETIKTDALKQTAEYADKCGASESHIIIFDRRNDITWDEKLFTDVGISPCGYPHNIKIWGM